MALLREGLGIQRAFNDYAGTGMMVADLVEKTVQKTVQSGDHEQAGRMLGAARALLRGHEVGMNPEFHRRLLESLSACETAVWEALGPAAEEALEEGTKCGSSGRAVSLVLDRGMEVKPSGTTAAEPNPLTRREREVATLVAQGLTNVQIAAELVLSPRTVGGHIDHIMTKLGFNRRAQIAAWWTASRTPAT
ncbi:helix-turn-helix transcriptional regulator [Streptomyces spongiae]|uniref:helix-turn-helix transcriptional regulator n=1 Tax=Streptomyces spongiae TaxID=565072 RepID=UPI001D14E02C|nr:LuxR C-terminal-related transcriptional regulator [Streptomyces spongiae]